MHMGETNLLDGLNEKQREAASHDKGPILVIAGAGTGKTRVLTHRIAHLINTEKARPGEILSITFTNKAASEMKERIARLIDYDIDRMWMGTFHSICVRMLRRDIERLGYEKNFVIYDTDDQKNVLKNCIKELELDPKKYNANAIKSIISNEKNRYNTPNKFIAENYANFFMRSVGEIYELYEKKLKICNALDFDDLLVKALKLLQTNPDIKEYYQNRFKYILVDEYQDTNNVQYNLVKILGKKENGENNVFVVGDDDQSIYGWRGADINNILDFEKDFENAKVVRLEKNYRSTDVILNAANSVIKNNCKRKGKDLYTDFEGGEPIKLLNTDNEKEEAFVIASNIGKEFEKGDIKYSEIAILYRANAQSRSLEEGLMAFGIPYKIVGGLKFYGRKEIKDIMSYLMLIENARDDNSFNRIVNLPRRKIGPKAIETLTQYASSQGISMFEACYDVDKLDIMPSSVAGIQKFVETMELLMVKKDALSLSEFIKAVYEDTGYEKMAQEDMSIEGMSRLENILEFMSAAKDFEERYEENSLEDFLAHVSLLSDVDKTDEMEIDRVTLLTVHSAKGLEFDVVFVAGLEERSFPIIRDDGTDDDLEEERRLFYVAATRAKKRLYLSYTNERIVFGHHEMRAPSRFISEIPAQYLNKPVSSASISSNTKKNNKFDEFSDFSEHDGFDGFYDDEPVIRKKPKKSSPFISDGIRVIDVYADIKNDDLNEDSDYSSNNIEKQPKLKSDKLSAGDKVRHKAWGIGCVISLSGEGSEQKATIAFEQKGLKTVMLSFAPIEKI